MNENKLPDGVTKTLPDQESKDLGLFAGPLNAKQWDNCEKWVKALRSGEYKQGRNGLHTAGGRHCCLGVADIACGLNETNSDYLFTSYMRLGLVSCNGPMPKAGNSLFALNDDYDWTFIDIAYLIECQMKVVGRC